MQNLYIYLAIFLSVKVLLVIIFSLLVFKGQLKFRNKDSAIEKRFLHENFYCVKSTLKRMNEHFYVAQMIFTNKKNCTLTTQRETPRRFSEDPE